MVFQTIKILHIIFVASSYALFLMRGIWSMIGSSIMRARWIKIVPHIIDTLLLISAIALAVIIHQYPFVDTWLTTKVIGLLLYIGLGFVALRGKMSNTVRFGVRLTAQGVFAYIVTVAITHNPFPWKPQYGQFMKGTTSQSSSPARVSARKPQTQPADPGRLAKALCTGSATATWLR